MHRDFVIGEEATLEEAMKLLNESEKGALAVVKGKRLVAMLADGDIRRCLLRGGNLSDPVKNAANYSPVFLFTSERTKAETCMAERNIRVMPVVDEDFTLCEVVYADEPVDLAGVKMRRIEPSDYDALMAFFDQMAGDTRAMFNRLDVNRIRAIKYLKGEGKNEVHFGAFLDIGGKETAVGYVFMWETDKTIPWLGIAVHEKYKGHGLGRSLLSLLDDYCLNNGYGGLLLTTVPANIRAHSLYARMGYEYLGNHTSGEYLYIKRFDKKAGE